MYYNKQKIMAHNEMMDFISEQKKKKEINTTVKRFNSNFKDNLMSKLSVHS